MSRHKYEMWAATCYVGSDVTEVIDLVDDWGYDESDLDQRTEEDIISEIEAVALDDFVWQNIDSGVRRVDG